MSPRTVRPGLSRRAFGATIATASLAFVAACGSDSDDSPAAGSNAAATDSGAFPVTIEHKFGSTEIKARPTRVVVVGLVEQDALLALGTVPISTTKWFGTNPGEIWPWAQDRLGSAKVPTVMNNDDGLQFEQIAALQPDLIVGLYSNVAKEDYDKLSQIAPTLPAPKDTNDYAVAWDVVTTTLAKALGQEAEGQKLVDSVNAKFDAAKQANPSFSGQTALMANLYEGYFVYSATDPRGRFLTSLGFTLPDGLADVVKDEYGANLSKERADLLDVNALVWLVPDPKKDKVTLADDEIYNKLDVFQNGGDIYLADGSDDNKVSTLGSATAFVTVLSLPYLIDNLVPLIAQAADDDPATRVQDESA